MASGIELATAYVQLIPSLRGAQREIQKQLGPIGQRSGQQFGEDFNDAASGEMGKSSGGFGGAFKNAGSFGADFGKKFGAAAALGIGAAVGASIKGAIDQEAETDRVAASLGSSPKEAARLGALAGKLYGDNFGDSFAGVSDALGAVRSSFRELGTGKELRTVTEQALNFADIFQIDLPRAVSVAQTVVKSGLAENATEALDLLTAASQRVPAALREDILDASNEYGQFFKQVGFSGEQAFAALVDNAKLGEFGIDKAGDAIKEFTIRSTDMSVTSVAAYKTIGLDAGKFSNALLRGGDIAGEALHGIVDGLLAIKNPTKQANNAIALFGTPLEDLGVKNIPAFLKSLQAGRKGLEGFAGAIDRAGETANDNASRNIEAFKRQVTQTFVNVIGKKVIPYVSNFAKTLSANLRPVVQKVREGIRAISPVLERVGQFLRDNSEFVKTFAKVLGVLAIAVAALTLVTTLFSIALNSTGIPLIIIGIALLAAGLIYAYKHSDRFRSIVDKIGSGLKAFGGFLSNTVLPAVVTLAKQVGSSLRPIFEQLAKTFATQVVPTLRQVFARLSEATPAIKQIVLLIKQAATLVLRWVGTLLRLAAIILGKVLPVVVKLGGFLFSQIVPAFAAVIRDVVVVIGGFARLGNAVLNSAGRFKEFAADVGAVVTNVVNKVTSGIGSLPDKIRGYIGEMVSAGAAFIGGLFEGIRSAASGAGGLVAGIASSVGDALKGVINGLIQRLNNAIPNSLGKGKLSINIDDNPIPMLYKGTSNFAGGVALVGERGPELVTLPRGSRVDTAGATARMARGVGATAASGGARRMVLQVGARDFVGYVSEIADSRVQSADDMSAERERATWSR